VAPVGGAGALPRKSGGVEYDAAAPRRRHATRRDAAAPAAASPAVPAPVPLAAPTGFRLAVPAEVVTGQALEGRAVLFRWPTAGCVRGTVGRRSRAAGFSHVARYGPRSALGAAVVASLIDTASHGIDIAYRYRLAWSGRSLGPAAPDPPPAVALTGRQSWASGRAMRAGPTEIFHNGTITRDSCIGTSCARQLSLWAAAAAQAGPPAGRRGIGCADSVTTSAISARNAVRHVRHFGSKRCPPCPPFRRGVSARQHRRLVAAPRRFARRVCSSASP
jgi:hypothetical protein